MLSTLVNLIGQVIFTVYSLWSADPCHLLPFFPNVTWLSQLKIYRRPAFPSYALCVFFVFSSFEARNILSRASEGLEELFASQQWFAYYRNFIVVILWVKPFIHLHISDSQSFARLQEALRDSKRQVDKQKERIVALETSRKQMESDLAELQL